MRKELENCILPISLYALYRNNWTEKPTIKIMKMSKEISLKNSLLSERYGFILHYQQALAS